MDFDAWSWFYGKNKIVERFGKIVGEKKWNLGSTGTSFSIFFFDYQVNFEGHPTQMTFKIHLVNKKENCQGGSSRSQISFFLTDDFPKSLDDFVFAVKPWPGIEIHRDFFKSALVYSY